MTFTPGALGGGGFVTHTQISPDGSTHVIRTDVAGAYIWEPLPAPGAWFNLLGTLPAPYNILGEMPGLWEIAIDPSAPDTIYVSIEGPQGPVYKSVDRGLNWTMTGVTALDNTFGSAHRLSGPRLIVDPNDSDHIYIADCYGRFFRSLDGLDSVTKITDLEAGLWSLTLDEASAANDTTLVFAAVPDEMIKADTWIRLYCYAPDNETALGTNAAAAAGGTVAGDVLSLTSTVVTLAGGNAKVYAPGLADNTEILFGAGPVIIFDPSFGVDVNGRTKRIYAGWRFSASYRLAGGTRVGGGIWFSEDAGATWAQLPGGPGSVVRMHVSNDGVLYACEDGTHYAPAYTAQMRSMWRYYPPEWAGSGTPDSWTHLTPTAPEGYKDITSDPLTPGKVVGLIPGGLYNRSDNYGDTFYGYATANFEQESGPDDPEWLGWTHESYFAASCCVFDPLETNKLWIPNGIGIWYTYPLASSAGPTYYSQTRGNEELITNSIDVSPATGYALVTVYDRGVFRFEDPNTGPAKHVISSCFSHGWDATYAKSDPTFAVTLITSAVTIANRCYTNTNGGHPDNWVQVTSPNIGDQNGSGGAVACASPTSIVVFPGEQSAITPGAVPVWSDDGGTTWAACTFDGGELRTGWNPSGTTNRRIVCADPNNIGHYYAFNHNTNVNGGGLYKSTDGGETFVKIATLAAGPNPNRNQTGGAVLTCVIDKPGHLWFAPGGSSGILSPSDVTGYRSVDGGLSWTKLVGMQEMRSIALGAAWGVGTNTYPTIYTWGYVQNSSIPGVFRCVNATDDPDTENLEWERVATNAAGSTNGISFLGADHNVFGKLWVPRTSCGYSYGTV
jgi:hypothetical protein